MKYLILCSLFVSLQVSAAGNQLYGKVVTIDDETRIDNPRIDEGGEKYDLAHSSQTAQAICVAWGAGRPIGLDVERKHGLKALLSADNRNSDFVMKSDRLKTVFCRRGNGGNRQIAYDVTQKGKLTYITSPLLNIATKYWLAFDDDTAQAVCTAWGAGKAVSKSPVIIDKVDARAAKLKSDNRGFTVIDAQEGLSSVVCQR